MAGRRAGSTVYLNVYDLHPNNEWAHQFGLGAYHSGVEVSGREYTYGHSDAPGTGVFWHAPKAAGGARFREQLVLGSTHLSSAEVDRVVDSLKPRFLGKDYHLLEKNCNSFSDALARALVGHGIPSYVNRLASIGAWCSCCLPPEMRQPAGVPSASDSEAVPLVAPARSSFVAFSGEGRALGSSSSSDDAKGAAETSTSSSASGAASGDVRRQRMRAAVDRLESKMRKGPAAGDEGAGGARSSV